ncbi:hypothetical protein C2845_PM16G03030 [Panicum miliaceum]|uniref:DNA2/NAM7 helicase-like C-terminal domain-containing protein n=1 Tax=Panicum miliaceum TaxID=4540 RepID=A0A3L6PVM6_PANMI|nr:hypothetical protein C2845_PM16G03030 [Panicum miliaceum]
MEGEGVSKLQTPPAMRDPQHRGPPGNELRQPAGFPRRCDLCRGLLDFPAVVTASHKPCSATIALALSTPPTHLHYRPAFPVSARRAQSSNLFDGFRSSTIPLGSQPSEDLDPVVQFWFAFLDPNPLRVADTRVDRVDMHDLGRMILSWSISSISKEVEIPNIQKIDDVSSLDYLKGFERPLIKQTKVMILSSLNSISRSPYYRLLGVLKRESDRLDFIDIDTTYGDHVVQGGDLFLLSSKEPNDLHELNNESGVFALAANIGHNNHYVRAFPAKTFLGDIKSEFRYAIFLCNISENAHIWNILHMNIGDSMLIKQIQSPSLKDKNILQQKWFLVQIVIMLIGNRQNQDCLNSAGSFATIRSFNVLAKEGITNEEVMTAFGIYSETNSPAKPQQYELLPTLSLPSIKHAWLIGDHTHQLCPTVKSQVSGDTRFGLSLFGRFISLGLEHHMLTTQYRMHPNLCSLANLHFYEGKILNAKSAYLDVTKSMFKNYMFVNVDLERAPCVILFLIKTILKAEGLPSDKSMISYLITRARKHLWIVGDEAKFATDLIWKSLIDDAKQQDSFIESTSHLEISASLKNNICSWDSLKHSLGITTIHSKTRREFSWLGRPYNGKLLLPPVRDQRGYNHCTLHSSLATMEFLNKHRSASLLPAEDFNLTFSVDRLLAKYIEYHGEFGKENRTGRERLENVLGTLQKVGAISESDNTVHMLSSFHEIYESSNKNEKSLEVAASKPRQGKALIGTFLLSQNYQEYRPEDIYMFDHKRPVLSPLSRKLSSHAVMLIGSTEANSKILLEDGYFVMQNSQGKYFGRGGIGTVAMSTIQRLYEITL